MILEESDQMEVIILYVITVLFWPCRAPYQLNNKEQNPHPIVNAVDVRTVFWILLYYK